MKRSGIQEASVQHSAIPDSATLHPSYGCLPVILVVGIRLGCLNRAFLSATAITADGLPLAGWVANLLEPRLERLAENLATLRAGIAAPCLGVTPFLPAFQPEPLASCLRLELLP